MKKLLTVFVLSLLILASIAAASGPYVASKLREPFHYTLCKWAKKIDPENTVYYQTREAAIADGHRPCKVCKP